MSEDKVKYVEMVEEPKKLKDGHKTSEFYVTLATMAIGFLMTGGVVTPDTIGAVSSVAGPILTGIAGVGYTLSRAIAKLNIGGK